MTDAGSRMYRFKAVSHTARFRQEFFIGRQKFISAGMRLCTY